MVRPALAAARALAVLNFFAAHPGGSFTLSELSSSLGINLASALSVLRALEDAGYLVRHPTRKTYELGAYPVALGDAALRGNPAVDLARGQMAGLARELGSETVIAALVRGGAGADGDQVVILATEGTPQIPTADVRPGQRVPLVPPLGQVFYAWSPEGRIEAWLSRLEPATREAVRAQLLAALAAVRARGYSVAVDRPARMEIGTVLGLLAEQPTDAGRLQGRLDAAAMALVDSGYELADVDAEAEYSIASVVAAVHDPHGGVALALMVNGLRRATGRQVTEVGERLAGIAQAITKQTGGRIVPLSARDIS
ncbi:helix-turn-helix domain-containing protein [Streptomyces sp. A7024]|uniref:Helix-turn-helix domain-containing protein n=1 Tax=Streptomyces coryli TaxID=1128680 RepID=A0A6G4U9B7_9ACTN|nr:helix-turn-helix domain-containing protein [Streptomyces coryli]NGN68296.1 helix-turn-helix domain-containing protein [Streptomyces coryli]